MREGDRVAVFNSIHRVMEAEQLLKAKKLDILLIPAPRAIAADCGLALRYPEPVKDAVEGTLSEAGLLPKDRYRKVGENFEKVEGE